MNRFDMYILVDLVTIILVYFLIFIPKWESAYERFVKSNLYVYMIAVFLVTIIIPFIIPIPFINMNPSYMKINFVPYSDVLIGRGFAIKESLLNIMMFIPFGILYPFIYNSSFKKTLFVSTIFTLSIEIWQLISARALSSCDITDVINNLMGAIIGYIIYSVLKNPVKKLLLKIFSSKKIKLYTVSKKVKRNVIFLIVLQLLIRSILIDVF